MNYLAQLFSFVLSFVCANMQSDFVKQMQQWIPGLFFSPILVVNNPVVHMVQGASTGLALTALTALIAVYGVKGKIDALDGNITTPPAALAKQAIWAGMAATGVNLIATFAGELSTGAVNDLLHLNVADLFSKAFAQAPVAVSGATWVLTTAVLGLGQVIVGLMVVVQRAVMTGEFMILLVTGPLCALSLLHGGRGWSLWWREVLALVMTPVLQVLIVWLFVAQFISGGADPTSIGSRLESFGLVYLLMKTPRWCRSWLYQSDGSGGGGSGMGRWALMQLVSVLLK